MPSIFIWKSDVPNTSKNIIRCYLGANWVLEDNDNGESKSYQLTQQYGFDNNNISVLVNNAKLMPNDWIGSELLEVIQCPYQLIKSDNYAKYELIGNWNRVTLYNTLDLFDFKCEIEITNILIWINQIKYVKKHHIINSYTKNNTNDKNINNNYKHSINNNTINTKNRDHTKNRDYTKNTYNSQKNTDIIIDSINTIESFEDAILKLNNITKEQLFNTMTIQFPNIMNKNLSTYNTNSSNNYNNIDNINMYKKYNKYDKQFVKLVSEPSMTIPLCSI